MEFVSLCVFLLPPLAQPSALWLSLVPTLSARDVYMCICASVRGSVHRVLTHTVSIFVHRSVSPQFLLFVFYVTNFLYKCSYHCLHCMPSVSSLLSLPGLALAPPLKRLVRHCLWPVDVTTKLAQKNKKDRKVSAYLTSSSKKEHKQTRIT